MATEKKWATCQACNREMAPGTGCASIREKMGDGSIVNRIPNFGDTCGDCNAGAGQYHHPGCDMEECPVCHGQAMGCDCYLTPEELASLEDELAELR